MATKVGVTSRGSQAQSMTRANDAIDSILANAAFDDRKVKLRRSYKQAEKQAKLLGARVTARAERYAKGTSGLSGLTNTINYQNRQAEQAAAAWEQAQKKHVDEWATDFNAKRPGLTGKERKKAWNEYVSRQAKKLPEYDTLMRLQRQGKASAAQYRTQAQSLTAQRQQYERMVKRQQRAYKNYVRAVKRYNKFTRFVPYQPA